MTRNEAARQIHDALRTCYAILDDATQTVSLHLELQGEQDYADALTDCVRQLQREITLCKMALAREGQEE